MSLTEKAVTKRFEQSLYHGTTFRWPFCRSYEFTDTRVNETAPVIIQMQVTEPSKEIRNEVNAQELCQKMRDEKTAACLKTFFSIIVVIGTITALTFAGMHLYKLYKK
jgi:hypothetical protein